MSEQPQQRKILACLDQNVVQQAREQVFNEGLLSAQDAVYKAKEAKLKANFKEQLRGILEDVQDDQHAQQQLKHQHEELIRKYDEALQHLTCLTAEKRAVSLQLDQAHASNAELIMALQEAQAAARERGELAESATLMMREEARRHKDSAATARLQAEGLQDGQRQALEQGQRLMHRLTEKDSQIASLGKEAAAAKAAASAAQSEAARLGLLNQNLGEQLAALHVTSGAHSETISTLHTELATLRDRYLNEITELKAARVSAHEAGRLKQQLDAAQGVSSALVEAREELRTAVSVLTARFAGEQERCRRLQAATSVKDTLLQALQTIGVLNHEDSHDDELDMDDNHGYEDADGVGSDSRCSNDRVAVKARGSRRMQLDLDPALDALAGELDLALQDNASVGARAAQLEAACSQQQAHIQRLSTELADKQRHQQDREEHMHALQRMVAELQSELKRLASQGAIGPPIVLDTTKGVLVSPRTHTSVPPMQGQGPAADNATAAAPTVQQLMSVVETACTAARVALADKGFSTRSLAARLSSTAAPMPLDALTATQRVVQAAANDMRGCLDSLSDMLAARPLDTLPCLEKLQSSCTQMQASVTELTQVRDKLVSAQVEVVSSETLIGDVEGCLHTASSLLSSWTQLMARKMCDGEMLDDALRVQLKVELQEAEQAVHKAAARLSSAALTGMLAAGDTHMAGAESGVREAQRALLELASCLPDRQVLGDAKLKAAVTACESSVREQQRFLTRLHAAVAGAPASCATLAGETTCVLRDMGELLACLSELAAVLQQRLDAGRDAPVDVVALQGEVLTLRAQLREAQLLVTDMEAQGAALRPTSSTMHTQPAGISDHSSAGPLAAITKTAGGVRALVPLEALQALERAREVLQDQLTELHATLVGARLRHTAARTAFTAYMVQHVRRPAQLRVAFAAWWAAALQAKAVAAEELLTQVSADKASLLAMAAQRRHAAMNVVSRMQEHGKAVRTHNLMLAWRLQAVKQVTIRQRWERTTAAAMHAITRYQGAYPANTVAQRLAATTLSLHDPWCPPLPPRSDQDLLCLLLHAWQSWVRNRRQWRRAVALSAGLPALVSALGSRRRMERAWLGWRLSVVDELVGRANTLLARFGQRGVGLHRRTSSTRPTQQDDTTHATDSQRVTNEGSRAMSEVLLLAGPCKSNTGSPQSAKDLTTEPDAYWAAPMDVPAQHLKDNITSQGGSQLSQHACHTTQSVTLLPAQEDVLPYSHSTASIQPTGQSSVAPAGKAQYSHGGAMIIRSGRPGHSLRGTSASRRSSKATGGGASGRSITPPRHVRIPAAAGVPQLLSLPSSSAAQPSQAPVLPTYTIPTTLPPQPTMPTGTEYRLIKHSADVATERAVNNLGVDLPDMVQFGLGSPEPFPKASASSRRLTEQQHGQLPDASAPVIPVPISGAMSLHATNTQRPSPTHLPQQQTVLAAPFQQAPPLQAAAHEQQQNTNALPQTAAAAVPGPGQQPPLPTHQVQYGQLQHAGQHAWQDAAQQQPKATPLQHQHQVQTQQQQVQLQGNALLPAAVHHYSYMPHVHTLLAGQDQSTRAHMHVSSGAPEPPAAVVHQLLHATVLQQQSAQQAAQQASAAAVQPATSGPYTTLPQFKGLSAAEVQLIPHAAGAQLWEPQQPSLQPGGKQPFASNGQYLEEVLVPEAVFEPRFAGMADPSSPKVHAVQPSPAEAGGLVQATQQSSSPGMGSPGAAGSPRMKRCQQPFTKQLARNDTSASTGAVKLVGTGHVNAAGVSGTSSNKKVAVVKPAAASSKRRPASAHTAGIKHTAYKQPTATSPSKQVAAVHASSGTTGAELVERSRSLADAAMSLAHGLQHVSAAISPRRPPDDMLPQAAGTMLPTSQPMLPLQGHPNNKAAGGSVPLIQQLMAAYVPAMGLAGTTSSPRHNAAQAGRTQQAGDGKSSPRRTIAGGSTLLHFNATAPASQEHNASASAQPAGLNGPDVPASGSDNSGLQSTCLARLVPLLPPDAITAERPAGLPAPDIHKNAAAANAADCKAEVVSHATMTVTRSTQPAGSTGRPKSGSVKRPSSSSTHRWSNVPSRLHQDTVATLTKRVDAGRVGGLPNLTNLGSPPPQQPIMAPMSMYVAPSRSVPGPISIPKLLSTGTQISCQTQARQARDQHSMSQRSGSAGSIHMPTSMETQALQGLSMVYGPNTTAAGSWRAGRPSANDALQHKSVNQLAGTEAAHTSAGPLTTAAGIEEALASVHGLGTLKAMQHTQHSNDSSSSQMGTAVAGNSSALHSNAQPALLQKPEPQPVPRIVAFNRPVAHQQTNILSGVSKSAGAQAPPLTVTIQLPEPVRFSLT